MSLPGVGLLSMLRGQSAAGGAAAEPATAGFAARSSAVHALEHAVASGSAQEGPSRKQAQGRAVPEGAAEYVYDMDAHAPHEAQVTLEVTPITMLHSEYEHRHHRQIAVNSEFMCYGLKQGHIRVLCRTTADRALCKGHSAPISDMAFAGGHGASLLASGSSGGQLIVWRLVHEGDAVKESQALHATFSEAGATGGLPDMHLAWRGEVAASELAVGVGSHVLLVPVNPELSDKLTVDLASPSGVLPLPGAPGKEVTALACSPDGALLAAGGAGGEVALWQLGRAPDAGPVPLRVTATGVLGSTSLAGGAVGALQWLPTEGGHLLVAGNANCTVLELWHLPSGGPLELILLQRVTFQCASGQQEFFNHVAAVPQARLLVVADTPKKSVYTIHYSGEGPACRFDYISRFGVAVPVLNFAAVWRPAGEAGGAGGEEGEAEVELFCVQTTAVQMYRLDPELCQQVEPEAAPLGRVSSLGQRPAVQGAAASSLPQPSSQLATIISHTPAATAGESELESTASAPPGMGLGPAGLASSVAEAAPAADGAMAAEASESGSVGREAAPAAEGAEGAPELQSEASIADRVSVLPRQPFPQPPAEDAGGGSPPSDLEEISGIPTPEEPASPPSTPVAGHQVAVPIPVPLAVSLPIEGVDAARAPEPSHIPQPHMAPPLAAGPRLLTPGEMAGQHPPSPPAERPMRPAPMERNSPSPSPSQPQPSLRILQRPHPPPPTGPLQGLKDIPLPLSAPLPISAAPAAPPAAALAPPAPAFAAAAVDTAALSEAVARQLGGEHKKYVSHVSAMYRELVKAMRGEMAAQARQTEAAVGQAVAAALEASAAQVQQERAAVLAEERGNFERLLVVVSTSLNQDLPNKLQEIVRAELAGLTASLAPGMAAAVAPAVQQAVQASLPKEVSATVKAQLEKQLAASLQASLQASLAKPLQEAFKTSFQKQLLPAFEGACQSMFAQINGSLAQGFQEHLQAAKAAVEEPGALTAQLRASLATAASLAQDLQKERAALSQQLSRTTSLGGPAGAAVHDVRAELSRDLKAGRFEEAFATALGLQDLATVVWLCGQADPGAVLGREPCPLSQMVLLSLVQQLAADLGSPAAAGGGAGGQLGTKLAWIREAAMLVNPADPTLAHHFRPVLEQVYASLQACAGRVHGVDASSCKLAMHVVHSQLVS